jgi:hypothetical protein
MHCFPVLRRWAGPYPSHFLIEKNHFQEYMFNVSLSGRSGIGPAQLSVHPFAMPVKKL